MRRLAILSTVALVGFGALATTDAEARPRRNAGAVVAAGVTGLAVGGLIGAAASNAYAAPAYGYSYPGYGYSAYGYPAYGYSAYDYPAYAYPAYSDDDAPVTYRTTRVVRSVPAYDERYVYAPAPAVRTTRVVRNYGYGTPVAAVRTVRSYDDGYAPVNYRYSWGGPAYGYYAW
jgi:hypothetical protein